MELTLVRKQIDQTAQIQFMRIHREFQYCYPTLKTGEDPRCKRNEAPFIPEDSYILNGLKRGRCPIGGVCKEGLCNGDLASSCLNPKVVDYMEPGQPVGLHRQTSLFHHSCTQYWGCDIQKAEVQLYLQLNGEVSMHEPHIGNLNIRDMSLDKVYLTDQDVFVQFQKSLILEESQVFVLCFQWSASQICHDKGGQKFFPFETRGHVCMENSCYLDVSGEITTVFDENKHAPLIANQLDLDSLYRKTQFLELQILWDMEQINKRIGRVEELFRRILTAPVGMEQGFLAEWIIGHAGKVTKVNGTEMTYTVCKETFREGVEDTAPFVKMPLISGIKWENDSNHLHLFSQPRMEEEILEPPRFKIDSLSYKDLHVIMSTSSIPSISGSAPNENNWEVFKGIIDFLHRIGSFGGLAFVLNRVVAAVR